MRTFVFTVNAASLEEAIKSIQSESDHAEYSVQEIDRKALTARSLRVLDAPAPHERVRVRYFASLGEGEEIDFGRIMRGTNDVRFADLSEFAKGYLVAAVLDLFHRGPLDCGYDTDLPDFRELPRPLFDEMVSACEEFSEKFFDEIGYVFAYSDTSLKHRDALAGYDFYFVINGNYQFEFDGDCPIGRKHARALNQASRDFGPDRPESSRMLADSGMSPTPS